MREKIDALNTFLFGKFPRELAFRKNGYFSRNRYINSAEELYKAIERLREDVFVSVFSFQKIPERGKQWNRSEAKIDRLFFDLDSKEDISLALKEAKKIIHALDTKPIVVFSGAKGFHVHIALNEVKVSAQTLKITGLSIAERFKLKTIDPSVFEIARVCRAPFSLHSSTKLQTTIISGDRIMKMDKDDVIAFAKQNKWDFPDFEINEELTEFLKLTEYYLKEEEKMKAETAAGEWTKKRILGNGEEMEIKSLSDLARSKRLKRYIEVLVKHGRLSEDEEIRERHIKSKWVAKVGKNIGAIEHIARVHMILMMIEEGFSDQQIHAIFKNAEDYNKEKTQYYIDYNRKWLKRKKG